ncbi:MAG: hypothetical protein AB1589_16245 [Cyanobacteriota bacterium]
MRHRLSRKYSYKSRHDNALNLEPYIQFEQERITRSRLVFHGIRFHLDQDILQSIQEAQNTGCSLYISRKLLTNLLYYALIDRENRLQTGLTFCTYYAWNGSLEPLMRSVISTDGEILQQIKSDCLEHPEFCRQMASAHYWLINQLLGKLRLGQVLKLNQLAWGISWVIAVVIVAIALPFMLLLIQVRPWMLIVLVLITWLLQWILQRLLRRLFPILGRWVLRQLLPGLLSHKPLEKKIAQGILAWLMA